MLDRAHKSCSAVIDVFKVFFWVRRNEQHGSRNIRGIGYVKSTRGEFFFFFRVGSGV